MLQNSELVPSEVISHPWLYVPSPHRLNSNSAHNSACNFEDTVGKWLLFHNTIIEVEEKLSPHDKAWQNIQLLVTDPSNTDIISAKCSTNWQGSYAGGAVSNGVICCYTANYRDKASVKRAADAIRKKYPYACNMFYKTDAATYAGVYRHQGSKAVSLYKHTLDCQLYERDTKSKSTKWILVDL